MQFLREEIEDLEIEGLLRSLRLVQPGSEGPQGPVVAHNGKNVVLMCSNNYLGLAGDPRLIESAVEAIKKYGIGSGSSRLISGNMKPHEELEDRIARFKGTQAALVFTSGWHANIGTISALADKGDLILSDELNHASIVDGCRLSRAKVSVYPHCDLNALEKALKASRHRRRLIVTDGVFSMDGDIAPLPEIAGLSSKYDAMLMVDEAHATGVFGKYGQGIVEHLGIQETVDIRMGTLGKAIGCSGAYIAGSRDLIGFLMNKARSFIFTTSLPPALCAAAKRAIDIVEEEGWRRERLWENVRLFSKGLSGFLNIPPAPSSPIVPVNIGEEKRTMKICEELLDAGVFCQGIRPPSVPPGTSRLRITLMATHTREHLEHALNVLRNVLASNSNQ